MFASIYVFVAILIIFAPMIMCNYPEMFKHNVEKEFNADDIFEKAAKIKGKLKNLKNLGGAAALTEMVSKNKVDAAPEAADET